jgi:hypothetical protein
MKHRHHIVPKHAGGADDPSNIIELTVEEHADAHRLLYEQYGRHQDWLAWQGLAGLLSKEEIVKEQLSRAGKKGGMAGKGVSGNRANGAKANWEKNREKIIITLRENGKYGHLGGAKRDWVWINNGIEAKKILADEIIPEGWKLGRLPMQEESKKKMRQSCKGINKGAIRTAEQRAKLAEYRKGRSWYHNPESGLSKQFKIDEVPEGWVQGRILTKGKGTWGKADSDLAKEVRDGGHDSKL